MLGLSEEEANDLFASHNDIVTLRNLVARITGAITQEEWEATL
jgi:hypothetical protein